MPRTLLHQSVRALTVAVLMFAGTAATAVAEPITVISGRFRVPWDDPTFFQFVGTEDLQLSGSFPLVSASPQQMCITGCAPGTLLNLTAVAGGETVSLSRPPLGFLGPATVNGNVFSGPFDLRLTPRLAGTFRFDAPSIVLPSRQDFESGVTFTAPFLFNGHVTGFAATDLDQVAPLFDLALTGRGTAAVVFVFFNGLYGTPGVTYSFAPTPEPATLALLLTALPGVVLARRKRAAECLRRWSTRQAAPTAARD